MTLEVLPFDPATYLTEKETIVEYLTIAFESSDPRDITRALVVIARARGGVDVLARESDIAPDELAQMLERDAAPDFALVTKITHALGARLSVSLVA